MPGFGDTEGPVLDGFFSAKLLAEVVQSLGKQHAFAIVAYAQVWARCDDGFFDGSITA